MAETPETLATGRGQVGLTVGNRVVSGVAPAGGNIVLQTDSSGNLVANTNVLLSEITAPAAPTAAGRLYVADVSGSTALFFLPPGGDGPVQVAIET